MKLHQIKRSVKLALLLIVNAKIYLRRVSWYSIVSQKLELGLPVKTPEGVENMPWQYWQTLPFVSRLLNLGVSPTWHDEYVTYSYDTIKVSTSPLDASICDTFAEAFISDEYQLGSLDLTDKRVLDIGANICDVSVAFMQNGAREVVAIEPLPMLHNFATKNIKQNGFENQITFFNIGFGDLEQTVEIKIKPYGTAAASLKYQSNLSNNSDIVIQQITIVNPINFLKTLSDKSFQVVKMDCEGFEYEILTDAFLEIVQPQILMVEYHDEPKLLLNTLKKFFTDVRIDQKNSKVGVIYASR